MLSETLLMKLRADTGTIPVAPLNTEWAYHSGRKAGAFCGSSQPAEPKPWRRCWTRPHLPAPVPPWWIAQWGRARWSCGNPRCTHSGQVVGRCRWASREAAAPWCTRLSRASAPETWWQSWRVRCPERDASLLHQTQTHFSNFLYCGHCWHFF